MNKSDIKKVIYNGNEINSLYWMGNLIYNKSVEMPSNWSVKGVWEDYNNSTYNGKPYILYNSVRYDDLQMDGDNNFYFYTDEVLTSASYMFNNYKKEGNSATIGANYNLTSVDLSHLDFSNVTYCGSMFNGCQNLTSVDLSHLDFSNVTYCGSLFNNCSNIEHIKFPAMEFYNCVSGGGISGIFSNCSKLRKIENYNVQFKKKGSNYSSSDYEDFYNCTSLTDVTGNPYFNGYSNKTTDLHYSPLTNASAMVFINGLSTEPISSNPIIRFSEITYDTLSEEQIALATSKGWSVVRG